MPGTHWQSDVTILNPHPTLPATYSVAFLDAATRSRYSKLTWGPITLPPLAQVSRRISSATSSASPRSYGAIMVRGDVAPLAPSITARTFNDGDPGKGTFGLSVPRPRRRRCLVAGVPGASLLIGLEQNDAAYTNIGIVNLKNDWAKVQLDFLDG